MVQLLREAESGHTKRIESRSRDAVGEAGAWSAEAGP
jgi:hypothetical protein